MFVNPVMWLGVGISRDVESISVVFQVEDVILLQQISITASCRKQDKAPS